MAQELTVAIVGTLVDDETPPWNDETAAINRRETTALTSKGGDVEILKTDNCAGKEVRLITSVTVKLLGDGTTARVHALLRLYEGSSCDTTDPEGPDVSYSRNVAANRSTQFDIKHPGDGGGSFRGFLHISNRSIADAHQ
jgi:hypothetical protein